MQTIQHQDTIRVTQPNLVAIYFVRKGKKNYKIQITYTQKMDMKLNCAYLNQKSKRSTQLVYY